MGRVLVREDAGKGLPEVADGLSFHLLLAVASGARGPAEERGVADGVEGIGQGLGLTGWGGGGKKRERGEASREGRYDGMQRGVKGEE